MNLNEMEILLRSFLILCEDGFDETALARAARAPQECIVGGEAAYELARVSFQKSGLRLDALQQAEVERLELGRRGQGARPGLPDIGGS